MDHTRDNPLKRFNAFWFAALLVTTFGIGALILWPLTHSESETATDIKAGQRLAIKTDVLKAQEELLNTGALANAIKAQVEAPNAEPTPGSMAVPADAPKAPAEGDSADSGEKDAAPADKTAEPEPSN